MAKQIEKKMKTRKKRKGLRFFITLLILIAAAGTVFWFGWVQFSLEEGEYAVVYSKSNGYESEVLRNGEFAWRWQALLPTNLTLHTFKLETRGVTVDRSGKLPSGDFYAAMVGEDVSFDWGIEVKIFYRMNPDSLPSLVADGLVAAELDSHYNDFESRLSSEIVRLIAAEVESDPEETIGNRLPRLEIGIKDKAAAIDGRIIIVDAAVKDLSYPDLVLYAEARRLVLDLMNKRQAVMTEVENAAVRREGIQSARLELLEEYGRVFDKYPILLDLFALEGNPAVFLLPPEEL